MNKVNEADRPNNRKMKKYLCYAGEALAGEIFGGMLWLVAMLSFWLVKTYLVK